MTITLINPEGLPKVEFFRHVAVATGSKLVFIAGQVAWDADGALVGGSFKNVAKFTTYVVAWTVDKMPLVREGRSRAFAKLGVTSLAPATLIGVAALYTPDLLVEIEAIAVLD